MNPTRAKRKLFEDFHCDDNNDYSWGGDAGRGRGKGAGERERAKVTASLAIPSDGALCYAGVCAC